MLTDKSRQRVISRLERHAADAIKQGKGRRRPISPTQQISRWLRGEEIGRLQRGEITPEQYAEYDARMADAFAERMRR